MKQRLYLLEKSFPEKVIIKNQNDCIEYTYKNADEFRQDIDRLIKISTEKDKKVYLLLDPSKCRNISFETVFGFFQQCGLNSLDQYGDIRFYHLDEKGEEVLEDLLAKYLELSNSNFGLKKYLIENFEKEGRDLIKIVVRELLSYKTEKDLVEYVEKYFLTDEILTNIWLNKYNMKTNIKSFIYGISVIFNNYNDIRQIIRNLLIETDQIFTNFSPLHNKYKKLADYYRNNNFQNYLTFEGIEKAIEDKFDYRMLLYHQIFEDYGYRFTSFDFDKKIAYIKVCY